MASAKSLQNLYRVDGDPDSPGSRQKAIVLLVLTALLWSSSGLFVKIISWGPFSILSARSMLATLVFLFYLRRINGLKFRWTGLEIAGALCYVGSQLFFIIGTKLTTAANAIFLQYTAPLYIALFGYLLLRERPQRADWVSMLGIFAGMSLFFGDELSFDGFYGNVFGILSGIAMAGMVLCLRKQKAGVPANTIFLGNLIGIVIGLPFLLQESVSMSSLGIIVYLGIVQTGLAFMLYSIAIKHIPALESILILTLEPICNPIWVFLIIGEVPTTLALVGGVFVVGAVAVRAVVSANEAAI